MFIVQSVLCMIKSTFILWKCGFNFIDIKGKCKSPDLAQDGRLGKT